MKFPYLGSIAVAGLNTLHVHSNTHGSVISFSCWHGEKFRKRIDGCVHLFNEPGHIVGEFPLADPVAALETILGPLQFRSKAEPEECDACGRERCDGGDDSESAASDRYIAHLDNARAWPMAENE